MLYSNGGKTCIRKTLNALRIKEKGKEGGSGKKGKMKGGMAELGEVLEGI